MSLFYNPPNSSVILDISGFIILKGAKCICFHRGSFEIHHIHCETEQECNEAWESFKRFLLLNQSAIDGTYSDGDQ